MAFWFDLAEQLGMSVRQAQQQIDSEEFSHWLARTRIRGPIGDQAAWLRHGILTANVAAPYTKKGRTVRASDFIPKWDAKPVQSTEQMKAVFRQAAKAFNRAK